MRNRKSKPIIFVIEDNETHLRLVRDLLVAHGMQVLHSSNPQEAIMVIEKARPDLILMDISLKEANGLDIAREIKGNPILSHIPIVALSAHATKKDEENARSAGCDDFILKPVNTRLFPRQIADNLGHPDN